MKNNFSQEITIAIILIGLLFLLINPLHVWMPDMMVMTLTVVLAAIFGLFATVIWKESAHDERENLHRMHADRAGFLAGSALLTAGIIFQNSTHSLDTWLVYTLGGMILIKIAVRIYNTFYH